MIMDIRCKAISSILCHITYDNGMKKDRLIAIGDLVDVVYNGNGVRKKIIGRVAEISTVGNDPNAWYIIVDGSDDFASERARFSPMTILDCTIIRKADQDTKVRTPLGETGVPYIRIVKGRLQYSKDGYRWHRVIVDEKDIIEPQEGTVPIGPYAPVPHPPKPEVDELGDDEDGIEDAEF